MLEYHAKQLVYVYILQISRKGIIELKEIEFKPGEALNSFKRDAFPIEGHVFIAPFYGNIDTTVNTHTDGSGTCYSKNPINDMDSLKQAKDHIESAGFKDFSPTYLIIATWDYHNDEVSMLMYSP